MSALLEVRGLSVDYGGRAGILSRRRTGSLAVDDVSFEVPAGESVGLVGESGSGKSSIARTVVGLQPAASGEIRFDGRRIDSASRAERRALAREIQMVFQDPYSSLNPRLTVQQSIGVAWRAQGLRPPGGIRAAVGELLELVGLDPAVASRYPHQFSGGQRQRIGIARAIALRPRLLVCDEAVSALDVSIRAQIVNLLGDLQRDLGLSYLFIAHDLSIVEHLCRHVVVLNGGRVVESGRTDDVYRDPREQYTSDLLAAIPAIHPWRDGPADTRKESR